MRVTYETWILDLTKANPFLGHGNDRILNLRRNFNSSARDRPKGGRKVAGRRVQILAEEPSDYPLKPRFRRRGK